MLQDKHSAMLKVVLVINLLMFFIESVAGWMSKSTALFADSLDMLGDAFVYGISLYAIKRGAAWGAKVSLVKGMIMLSFGVGVLSQAVYRFLSPVLPEAEWMGWVGGLALVANAICAVLLLRHRDDDINMKSTWLCSRNDVIANIGVLIAAGLVAATQSRYPDLIVGTAIAVLVLQSGYSVVRESAKVLRRQS